MRTIPTTQPWQFPIANDYDVIVMRQEVRQLARELGLGLARQAKLAAAISMVARMLLATNQGTTIRMWTSDPLASPALEIVCLLLSQVSDDLTQIESTLRFDELRALVDTVTISIEANETLLNLRIQLDEQG
jgi:hypothetical protein